MKKIIILLLAVFAVPVFVGAVKMKDLKIYINPGHGGYDNDDRNITVYPYELHDTLGVWESKSNLYKGLHMYHILDSLGATPVISRVKNRTEDDRSLYGISQEANDKNCDLFLSIHSNAGEDVNYPLMLYRENAVGTPRYPEAIELSNIIWDNLHSSKLSIWTKDKRYVSGDLTFYPHWGTSGLGVLRRLYVVGLLSEGQMHEHRPEGHRLLNDDFMWLEAWHFVKSIMEFMKTEDRFVTGNVAGVVYDDNNTREKTMLAHFKRYGRDKFQPACGAYIELRDMSGNVIQKRTTDHNNNGVFVFRNVKPGNYKIVVTQDGFYDYSKDVTVVANEVTYNDVPLSMKRQSPLVIESFNPNPQPDELVNCVTPIEFRFNHDIKAESFEKAFKIVPAVEGEFEYSESYHVVKFKPLVSYDLSTNYTVTLSTELCTPDPYYEQSHLAKEFVLNFTTESRNRLAVVKSFPEENGTVHFEKSTLEVRFDKKLNAAGIFRNIKVYDSKNNEVGINTRASSTNKLSNGYGNIRIVLAKNLELNEKYRMVLSKDITDVDNIPLTEDLVVNFTAEDVSQAKDGDVILDFENKNTFTANEELSKGVNRPFNFYLMNTHLFGKSSIKFSYDFANVKGGEVVADYVGEHKIFKTGNKVGIHVFGDLNDHELYLGFTAGTDTKYFKVCNLNFVGWHYYEIPLNSLEENFEYLLSKVKLVQTPGLYAQNGGFQLDDMLLLNAAGVDGIEVDNVNANVNATDGIVTINCNDFVGAEIYNVQGSLVKVSQTEVIDCSSLGTGAFFVKVYTQDGSKSFPVIL